jgi:ketosteroid isomerase-like protein
MCLGREKNTDYQDERINVSKSDHALRSDPCSGDGAHTEGGVITMSPIRMSRLEAATRVVLEFNQAFNRHDVAGMMQLMSDDCVFENTHPAPDGTVSAGKEAVTQFWQVFFRESPQAHLEIEEIFGFGERCIVRWRYDWVDAAGKKGHVRGVDIFRVRSGSIREKLSYVKG